MKYEIITQRIYLKRRNQCHQISCRDVWPLEWQLNINLLYYTCSIDLNVNLIQDWQPLSRFLETTRKWRILSSAVGYRFQTVFKAVSFEIRERIFVILITEKNTTMPADGWFDAPAVAATKLCAVLAMHSLRLGIASHAQQIVVLLLMQSCGRADETGRDTRPQRTRSGIHCRT